MRKFLKSLAAISTITAMFALVLTSSAAGNPASDNGNKLQCFSGTTDGGYNGTCQLIKNGAYLNTYDFDSDPNNSYAGVYILNNNVDGKLLSEVNKLSFTYSAEDGTTTTGGSPRFSIPIDENNDGTSDGYAFIDAVGCTNGTSTMGTVDVINDATCTISYNNVGYANWSAFVTANPTFRITANSIPFIIVDQPGAFTITNVQLGRGAAKSR